jgi:endonuclease III
MNTYSPLRRGARKRLALLDAVLDTEYRAPEETLGNKRDPLDEAIYIILSFQTDLARFGSTWSRLKVAFPTWELLENAPPSRISRVLHEGGLQHQKTRTIKQLLHAVRATAGSLSLDFLQNMNTAAAEEILLSLPGFSWKSARCVLLYSLGRDVFPVDSNTFRILKRAGVVRADAIYRRRALHDALQNAVSDERRRALHVNLVVHGQRTCLPLLPRCCECAARPVCPRSGIAGRAQSRGEANG